MWRSPSSNICRINHLKIPDIPHPSSDCPMIFQYSLLYYYSLTISPYWVCLKIGYPVSLKFMVYRPCRHKQWHFLGATINIPWNQPLYSRIFPYHIWRFPKIGLPLNHHPFDFRIHYKFINHLLGGALPYIPWFIPWLPVLGARSKPSWPGLCWWSFTALGCDCSSAFRRRPALRSSTTAARSDVSARDV